MWVSEQILSPSLPLFVLRTGKVHAGEGLWGWAAGTLHGVSHGEACCHGSSADKESWAPLPGAQLFLVLTPMAFLLGAGGVFPWLSARVLAGLGAGFLASWFGCR